jgi:hypothetical protein
MKNILKYMLFLSIFLIESCSYLGIGSEQKSPEQELAADCHLMEFTLFLVKSDCETCNNDNNVSQDASSDYLLLEYIDMCIINIEKALESYRCKNC